jgi:hypothetical protein
MAPPRPFVGVHAPDLDGLHAQLPRSPRGHRLGLAIASSAPSYERAANAQQRCGVLDDYLERGQRPRGDQVEPLQSLAPCLGAGVDDFGVLDPALPYSSGDERTPSRRALDKRNPRGREGDREW